MEIVTQAPGGPEAPGLGRALEEALPEPEKRFRVSGSGPSATLYTCLGSNLFHSIQTRLWPSFRVRYQADTLLFAAFGVSILVVYGDVLLPKLERHFAGAVGAQPNALAEVLASTSPCPRQKRWP